MTRENQREDAFKDLQKTSACHAEICERTLPAETGSPQDQDSCLTAHAGNTASENRTKGMSKTSMSAESWITHSASGRRTPQTRVQPWSICTAGRASLDWTCSSESRCPSPPGFLSGCRREERAGLRRDTQCVK